MEPWIPAFAGRTARERNAIPCRLLPFPPSHILPAPSRILPVILCAGGAPCRSGGMKQDNYVVGGPIPGLFSVTAG
ncbi:hypothetical protein [Legionella taurinensis]|uniref:hypothetical protein n=1 Tax=Legionella taurinensis TaxID=70611 RepID=UPI0010AA127E|nr:hypothetical protein [Legionella taurinensis]MDX1838815.1 hypothetical protein [Legionella taurinensis]